MEAYGANDVCHQGRTSGREVSHGDESLSLVAKNDLPVSSRRVLRLLRAVCGFMGSHLG